ncbi:uncharacterized protein [Procambarus clarkii]|uniref:uncharacterized protein n=1 Tax=Procambarus clarkii TaxID=6728 RepID=UPI001E678C02|nr:uncharacterized protein LOC123752995 [Procambarus clarkii]
MTGAWLCVLVALVGLQEAEAGVRVDKKPWDTDYDAESEDSGSLHYGRSLEMESDEVRKPEQGARGAGSGQKKPVQADVEDNKIHILSQSKKEALKKKAQDQRMKVPLKASEVAVNVLKRIMEPFLKEDCLELVLCHMGRAFSSIPMVKMGVGIMVAQVPAQYYDYANAFVTGVMDSRCSYHCAMLYPREEL